MVVDSPNRSASAGLAYPAVLCLALVSVACGGDDGMTMEEPPPAMPRRPPARTQVWQSDPVVEGGGLHVELALVGDRPAVVYYATEAREDGPCEEIGGDDLPTRLLWDLFYAEERAGGFERERISEVLSFNAPQGLDFGVAPDGTPTVSALTGGPHVMLRFCAANDLGIYTRDAPGSWSVETAVSSSGEAATGMPASDYGEVVGHWPGLAFDASGAPAVAYKDVHAGGIQNDDFERADLELAWRGGGSWRALPVDAGGGAGSFNRMVFDEAGRPVIAYYDAQRGVPVLVSQSDDERFDSLAEGWSETSFGDTRFDEGYSPSLALDDSGNLAVAYYRCGRAGEGLGECDSQEDGLVFAHRQGDAEFEYEVVDEGDSGVSCGRNPSLAFEAQGVPIIAYECEGMDDGSVVDGLRFARREAL